MNDGEVGEMEPTQVEAKKNLTQKQVELIEDTFERKLPVSLYGGYAEEALLHSKVTTDHHDVDMLTLRRDKEEIRKGFEELGCNVEEHTEEGADKPYKFLVKRGNVEVDVAFVDWNDEKNQPYAETRTPDGKKVRAFFDKEAFDFPTQKLGSLEVKTASPLMQMQMRETFQLVKRGKPREQDLAKQEALRKRFFPNEDINSNKFKPEIVTLEKATQSTILSK
jgi:hypothetical protein